ncbi:MAG: FMN-binding negative transcriptional regulator [bacterium]
MSGGYEMYAGRSDEEAIALLTNTEYGHLTARGTGAASLGPSFVHYAPRPAEREIWVHLANTNPLLAALELEPQAILTVSGPAAYIPSHWLDSPHGVPTSYYSWARFEVDVTLLRAPEEIVAVLKAMLERFQPEGDHPAMDLADPIWQNMVGAITGLRLSIRGARSRFKYGQNRSAAVREGIVHNLQKRDGPQDKPVAKSVLERMGDGADLGETKDAAMNGKGAGR